MLGALALTILILFAIQAARMLGSLSGLAAMVMIVVGLSTASIGPTQRRKDNALMRAVLGLDARGPGPIQRLRVICVDLFAASACVWPGRLSCPEAPKLPWEPLHGRGSR